jgi:hypothetical protein
VPCRITRYSKGIHPPRDEIRQRRDEGYLWCPYCRSWRFFKLPQFYPHAEVGSEEWFLNSYRNQNIPVCAWCRTSVSDWFVLRANSLFGETETSRKRHRNRRKRR